MVRFILQTSSYTGTLQGEPLCCVTHFARDQTVTGELPLERDVGLGGFEKRNEFLDAGCRNYRIHAAGENGERPADLANHPGIPGRQR